MTDSIISPVKNPILTLKLSKPLVVGESEITEILMREPTLRDISEAGFPINIDDSGKITFNEASAPLMLSRLSNIPMFILDKLPAKDAIACFYGVAPLFYPETLPTRPESTT